MGGGCCVVQDDRHARLKPNMRTKYPYGSYVSFDSMIYKKAATILATTHAGRSDARAGQGRACRWFLYCVIVTVAMTIKDFIMRREYRSGWKNV